MNNKINGVKIKIKTKINRMLTLTFVTIAARI